jgi:hypothetical protein
MRGLRADDLASALRELHAAGKAVKSIYAAPISSPSHTEVWAAAMNRAKEVLESIDSQPELTQGEVETLID